MPRFAEQKPRIGQWVLLGHWQPDMRPVPARYLTNDTGEEVWSESPGADESLVRPDDVWEPFESPEETRAINEALGEPPRGTWGPPRRAYGATAMTIREEAALRVLQGFASRPESHRLDPSIAAATAFEWADAWCDRLERRA
jgi:hypothetical protein